MSNDDLIQTLAGIPSGSELAESRQFRRAATEHTQGSYQALFRSGTDAFPLAARAAIAAQVADWHRAETLSRHYQTLAVGVEQTPLLAAAVEFAHRLTFEPVSASAQHVHQLQQSGWQTEALITLAQLIGFVSFQSRLIYGFSLLARLPQTAREEGEKVPEVKAGRWHTQPRTSTYRRAPQAFTRKELGWEPWLTPKPYDAFTQQQQEVLVRFGHQHSDYFLLLGHDQPVLEQRTLTDKGIFYTPGGLTRAERELAATVVSKVNGCIYCASVHARKASQLAKKPEEVALLLQVQPGDALSVGQSERWQIEIEAVAALSLTPPRLTEQHLYALQQLPLTTLEITDLIQSAAFFAWANRLMLTLGEPFIPEPSPQESEEKTTSA
ncbi:alkylhydroperoxidase domain protein [Rosenbergiella collisarenosi]|uniref:alkylhydroperoxidase domain protein n=1 Tax=Rosenbergiella collisarenosi TaxID=1544695 RepID=UPI001BD92CAA|nr:alkylhydroperoxidase domain protein [Rosenbergiella collisarenosi]MBT0722604.1 alkylhydroperoxidase domain protein [Rosenbergiella collisarenosi]